MKKQQIRDLAEEASNTGKSKVKDSNKIKINKTNKTNNDPNEIKKELMMELKDENVMIINKNNKSNDKNNKSNDNNDNIDDNIDNIDDDDDDNDNNDDDDDDDDSDNDNSNNDSNSVSENDNKGILNNIDKKDKKNKKGKENTKYNTDNTDNKDNTDKTDKIDNNDISQFKENVIKFVRMDDLIRQKMEEIKELKDQKKPFEEFILGYLEKKDSPFVNIKSGKLIKNKSETKAPLKLDIIKESIVEGIKSENNLEAINEIKCNDIS